MALAVLFMIMLSCFMMAWCQVTVAATKSQAYKRQQVAREAELRAKEDLAKVVSIVKMRHKFGRRGL